MMRVLLVLVVLAAGCGSSPATRFYTLTPAPPSAPAAASSDLSVLVSPVSVPLTVDRPQMVVAVSANQVTLDEFNRWASPLANNIARVVAENLAAMLGTSRVAVSSQALMSGFDYRAAIEVQRFESALGEAVTLDAVWAVSGGADGRARTGRTTAREAVPDKTHDALAAGHSRALAKLSRDIAEAVRALDLARR